MASRAGGIHLVEAKAAMASTLAMNLAMGSVKLRRHSPAVSRQPSAALPRPQGGAEAWATCLPLGSSWTRAGGEGNSRTSCWWTQTVMCRRPSKPHWQPAARRWHLEWVAPHRPPRPRSGCTSGWRRRRPRRRPLWQALDHRLSLEVRHQSRRHLSADAAVPLKAVEHYTQHPPAKPAAPGRHQGAASLGWHFREPALRHLHSAGMCWASQLGRADPSVRHHRGGLGRGQPLALPVRLKAPWPTCSRHGLCRSPSSTRSWGKGCW